MRVLHLWEWAGIASILSHYLRQRGHESIVLKSQDYFGYLPFYGQSLLHGSSSTCIERAMQIGKSFDVIHVHAIPRAVFQLRKAYPNKKIIMHYHGSEARGGNSKFYDDVRSKVDHVFVSTKDLQEYVGKSEWLPNIVDTDHFKLRYIGKGEGCLAIYSGKFKQKDAENIISKMDMHVELVRRQLESATPYKDMPKRLRKYNTYLDLKVVNELSTTALQALSLGLKVIKAKGEVVTKFPEQHSPEKVINRLLEVYNK